MFQDANHPYSILNSKYGFFGKNRLVQEKISAIAWIISNEKPVIAISHLFPYLLIKHEKMAVKSVIAQSIALLMQSQVELNGKHLFGYRFTLLRSIQLGIEDIQLLNQFVEKLTLLGIASINFNGYIREAALKRLAEVAEQSEALPYLLALMNDHVPQIRAQALEIINRNIAHYPLHTFITFHKGFHYLDNLKYAQEYQLITKIHALIRESEHRHDILHNLTAFNTQEIIVIIDALYEDIQKDPALFERIMQKINPFIFNAVIKYFDNSYFSDFTLHKLLNNKYPSVRREALLLLTTEQVKKFNELIYGLLQDTSINVRQTAGFVLSKHETLQLTPYYRELVKTPASKPKPGAIMGFAERAQEQDIPTLALYMTHSNKMVRTFIMANLYRLSGENVIPLILKGLFDPSASVRALVVRILQKSSSSYDNTIRAYFKEGNYQTRRSCFNILSSRKSYEALNDILTAEITQTSSESFPIKNTILNWCRLILPKVYSPLKTELYHAILEKLNVLDPKKERYAYLYLILEMVHKK